MAIFVFFLSISSGNISFYIVIFDQRKWITSINVTAGGKNQANLFLKKNPAWQINYSSIILILVHVFLMVLPGGMETIFVILFHQFSTLNRPFLY